MKHVKIGHFSNKKKVSLNNKYTKKCVLTKQNDQIGVFLILPKLG